MVWCCRTGVLCRHRPRVDRQYYGIWWQQTWSQIHNVVARIWVMRIINAIWSWHEQWLPRYWRYMLIITQMWCVRQWYGGVGGCVKKISHVVIMVGATAESTVGISCKLYLWWWSWLCRYWVALGDVAFWLSHGCCGSHTVICGDIGGMQSSMPR